MCRLAAECWSSPTCSHVGGRQTISLISDSVSRHLAMHEGARRWYAFSDMAAHATEGRLPAQKKPWTLHQPDR